MIEAGKSGRVNIVLESIDIPTTKQTLEDLIKLENPTWWEECPINQENVYSCDKCKNYIVTLDVDRGVTQMFLPCKFPPCTGDMVSHGYPPSDTKPDVVPDASWEWYRPEIIDGNPEELEYMLRGGLLLREKL